MSKVVILNMMMRLVVCLLLWVATLTPALAKTVRVYAAASLTNALTDIAKHYEQSFPMVDIRLVFAGSSTLAKQIALGAPADIFFSADAQWMQYLVDHHAVQAQQVRPALTNRLVLISPKHKPFEYSHDKNYQLAKAFAGKLCTGEMNSVPVGMYARQSLMHMHWFGALKGRIVGANDVRAALRLVERAECDAGIVYATDAKISQKIALITTLAADSHPAIVYPVALTKQSSSREAAHFLSFLLHSVQAKHIFLQYGFALRVSAAR